jgi:uncharacterized protein YbbC (DUF1343 family)
MIMVLKNYFWGCLLLLLGVQCMSRNTLGEKDQFLVGGQQMEVYLPLLKGKQVGLVVNHTSLVQDVHLVDTMLKQGIEVRRIFAPEHGFRGTADAGEHIQDGKDAKTGIEIVSLYGKNRKPTQEMINDLDVLIFDIQDVGVRFYTYISTMHYVMEACAEFGKKCIVLDRPNPNGDYFDGPVLEKDFQSFVGMHPIPVVHGLTVGELALMINGEGWLANGLKCDVTVVPVKGYKHSDRVSIPIKPSPNLPNDVAIRLYPSLCFFEASKVSVGRGTTFPFQVYGYPDSALGDFTFMPVSLAGMAKHPKLENQECFGKDLRRESLSHQFTLSYLLDVKDKLGIDIIDNTRWFNLLAGNASLLKDIQQGATEAMIRESWKNDLASYAKLRDKYLLYPQ